MNKKPSKVTSEERKIIYIRNLIYRTMYGIILFLAVSITMRQVPNFHRYVYHNVYQENLSFATITMGIENIFGNIIPFDFNNKNNKPVFAEKLEYSNIIDYHDGVKLSVANHYLVNLQISGIIVAIEEKKHYGNTIVVQQVDGKNVWYGNITNINVDLYDYVEAGTILGEVNGDNLYIVYLNNDEFLDPCEFLDD